MYTQLLKSTAKIILSLGLALSVACANLGAKLHSAPEEAVKQRAQAWANALLAGNLDEAWAYTSPHYRKFSSSKDYSRFVLGSGRWTSAVVDSVNCSDDVCNVMLIVNYEIKQMKMKNQRPLEYKWVRVDGEWWLHVSAN